MNKKPSLKDVARAANVHVSTVSRALNPETAKLLSAEVAARVAEVAAQLGYCPNAMAAGLRTAKSRAVGVVVPDLSHPLFPQMLRGVEGVLRREGYVALVVSVEHDFTRAPAILRELEARRVDGLIVATAQMDDPFLAAALSGGKPMVSVNADDALGRFPAVMADDAGGIAQALNHLRALGHTRIAHLAGPHATRTGQSRRAAFQQLGGGDWIEAAASYDREGGANACRALLRRHPGLTAIVTANDLLALGCYDALAEAGLRCPEDVSVTGFMDLPYMDLVSPPLTTVRLGQQEMGVLAAGMILDRISHPAAPVRRVQVEVALVARRSTAPVRA